MKEPVRQLPAGEETDFLRQEPLKNQILFLESTSSWADEESGPAVRGVYIPSCDPYRNGAIRTDLESAQKTVLCSLSDFFALAAAGNPAILALLGPDPRDMLFCCESAGLLFENAQLFLSRQIFPAIQNCSVQALKHLAEMEKEQSDPEKLCAQAARITGVLLMGIEILRYGILPPLRRKDQELLKKIRAGEFLQDGKLKQAYLDLVFSLKCELFETCQRSRLPETCDWKKLDALYQAIVSDFEGRILSGD